MSGHICHAPFNQCNRLHTDDIPKWGDPETPELRAMKEMKEEIDLLQRQIKFLLGATESLMRDQHTDMNDFPEE